MPPDGWYPLEPGRVPGLPTFRQLARIEEGLTRAISARMRQGILDLFGDFPPMGRDEEKQAIESLDAAGYAVLATTIGADGAMAACDLARVRRFRPGQVLARGAPAPDLAPRPGRDTRTLTAIRRKRRILEEKGYRIEDISFGYQGKARGAKVRFSCLRHPAAVNWRNVHWITPGSRCVACAEDNNRAKRTSFAQCDVEARRYGWVLLDTAGSYDTKALTLACPNGHVSTKPVWGLGKNGGGKCRNSGWLEAAARLTMERIFNRRFPKATPEWRLFRRFGAAPALRRRACAGGAGRCWRGRTWTASPA